MALPIKELKSNIRLLEKRIKPLETELSELEDQLSKATLEKKIKNLSEKYLGKYFKITFKDDANDIEYVAVTKILNEYSMYVDYLNIDSQSKNFALKFELVKNSWNMIDDKHQKVVEITKDEFKEKCQQCSNSLAVFLN